MKQLIIISILGCIAYGTTLLGSEETQPRCPDWTTLHVNDKLTPDNDNINDTWRITYNLYCWEDVEFWVYNDKNEEVYHDYGVSFDLYPFWDGTINKKYVPDGEYSYIIKATKITTGETIEKTGHFTLKK